MRPGKTGEGGPQRRALVEAVASGMSWIAAAQMAGVSKATLARQMQSATFRQEVARARAERSEQVLGALSAVALESVATLRELLNSGNDSVRASAVRTALEGLLKFSSAVTLEERITRIEAALAERDLMPVVPGLKAVQ